MQPRNPVATKERKKSDATAPRILSPPHPTAPNRLSFSSPSLSLVRSLYTFSSQWLLSLRLPTPGYAPTHGATTCARPVGSYSSRETLNWNLLTRVCRFLGSRLQLRYPHCRCHGLLQESRTVRPRIRPLTTSFAKARLQISQYTDLYTSQDFWTHDRCSVHLRRHLRSL